MTERAPCVRGRFEDFEAFRRGLEAIKESGQRRYEAFGPTELEEIEDLMPKKGSPVRGFATFGGFLGLAILWLMCVLTSLIYNIYVGGKPPISNVPYIIPAYEGTILFGAVMAFVAVLIFAGFGDHSLPAEYDPRYSQDSYGIHVYCGRGEKERVAAALREAGAVEIDEH